MADGVVSSPNGILPEYDHPSHRRRRRRAGAFTGSPEHDAGRVAEPLPEIGAVAGAAAIRCDCHRHARGLGDGALD